MLGLRGLHSDVPSSVPHTRLSTAAPRHWVAQGLILGAGEAEGCSTAT